ncbi:MAG: 50S ribosomal protein L10 [Candidatus Diapherotrites archaeon]|nr:50S ribosomal protein L10 [Candidatus Diapherotrites archaeon]
MVRKNILKKQKVVQELVEMLNSGKTVAVADVTGVPAKLLQETRKGTHGKAKIKVVKKRLLLRALEQIKGSRQGIEGLEDHIQGQVAVIVSDEDPFRLFKMFKQYVEYLPVKAGAVAETDIIVPKGVSGVPAPMIAEIKSAGIPSKVSKGFVEITEEYVAVKAGEPVPTHIAKALALLDVRPVEARVKINAAWSEGMVFTRDVLDVSVEKILADMAAAARNALNLAVNAGYPAKKSMPLLIAKAYMNAMNLAVNAGVVNEKTVKQILAKARAQALALAGHLPEDVVWADVKAALAAQAASAPAQSQPEEKAEEEEEENKEEEAAAGLASLFG